MSFEKKQELVPEMPDKLTVAFEGQGEVPYIGLEPSSKPEIDVFIDGYLNPERRRAITEFAGLFAHEIAVTAQDSAQTGSRKIQTSDDILMKYQTLRSSFQNWLDNASGFDAEEKKSALAKFQDEVHGAWSAELEDKNLPGGSEARQEAEALWKALNNPEAHALWDERAD